MWLLVRKLELLVCVRIVVQLTFYAFVGFPSAALQDCSQRPSAEVYGEAVTLTRIPNVDCERVL